jgi:hypothetical protein
MDLEPEKRMAAAILAFDDDPVLKKPQYCRLKGHNALREAVIAAKLFLDEGPGERRYFEPDRSREAGGDDR